MKSLLKTLFVILLLGLAVLPARAGFNSLYVFGDALSATADGTGTNLYYQNSDSNGRVWVEVLAQRQGLVYDASKNISYFDHNSATSVTDVNNFKAPPDVANDLFIVWVCNADTFDAVSEIINDTGLSSNTIYGEFQATNNVSQANHLKIITALYAKGVRTLIMPNAVDISKIPAFNAGTKLTGVEHAGCMDYNLKFSNTIRQAMALCPGLQIYTPNFFTLLSNVLTNASSYGLTNALSPQGFSIDAVDALYSNSKLPVYLNGPGTNYIFWDPQDPTAKLHEIMADVVQQIISPVKISQVTVFNGGNRLDLENVPVGLNGFVDGCTNLAPANWTSVTNITSTSIAQSIFVTAPQLTYFPGGSSGSGSINPNSPPGDSGPALNVYFAAQFYRLHFPYAWSWP